MEDTARLKCLNILYTAISRNFVGRNVHATISKGNMGYDQYTVPDDCSCRRLLLLLSFSTRKHIFMAFRANSFKFLWKQENSKPPTMPFRIVACTFPDNLSRNSCMRECANIVLLVKRRETLHALFIASFILKNNTFCCIL